MLKYMCTGESELAFEHIEGIVVPFTKVKILKKLPPSLHRVEEPLIFHDFAKSWNTGLHLMTTDLQSN